MGFLVVILGQATPAEDDWPPEVDALCERLWSKYSVDGTSIPDELVPRVQAEFEAGLTELGYRKPQ